jgi:dimethylhistidine N-methyltransferase
MSDDLQDLDAVPDTGATEFTSAADSELWRFRADVLSGLQAPRKTLPCKYFYDARGSQLFETICDLPEYYLTRTETALLSGIAPRLAARIPDGAALVELGSGASTKTRILLDAAPQIDHYVPIDISETALEAAANAIERDYPALSVTPLVEDFTQLLDLPAALDDVPLVGFFPGSTLGNFAPHEAIALLQRTRLALGADALLIVGVDLAKDPAVLRRAYDDAERVTAAFNLNLLTRINRELAGTFDLEGFAHRAAWNAAESRIEMHLVSRRDQLVFVDGEPIRFRREETIHTENSHKYSPARFEHLATRAGWRVEKMWSSEQPAFGIFLLTTAEESAATKRRASTKHSGSAGLRRV